MVLLGGNGRSRYRESTPAVDDGRVRTALWRWKRLYRECHGSSELTVSMLMRAAGCALVGLTLPSLYASAEQCVAVFRQQVSILQGSNAHAPSGESWSVRVSERGVTATGPLAEGSQATLHVGSDGASATASRSSVGSGPVVTGSGTSSVTTAERARAQQELLLRHVP